RARDAREGAGRQRPGRAAGGRRAAEPAAGGTRRTRGPVVVHRRRDGAGRDGRRPGRGDHRRVSGGRRLHAGSHPVKLVHSGKVRDVYADGHDLVLVASDRVSIYDVVLPTPIPDKGAVLTQLSLWWFDRLGDLVPNHVISGTEVPPEFAGRAMRCRRLEMLPVECVARGYLTGSGLKDYEKTGVVSGVALPPGLVDGSQLPEPVFTPSTKVPLGQHDEAMTF